MANALADMGFDAIEIAENVAKADLRRIPALIAEQAAQADVVLVFYAGHGVETGGVNYLVPTDAALDDDKALQKDALALVDLTADAWGHGAQEVEKRLRRAGVRRFVTGRRSESDTLDPADVYGQRSDGGRARPVLRMEAMVLLVKQLLYFERYAKELAPNYKILADPEILRFLVPTVSPS